MRTATLPDWTLTVAPFASADRRPAARWERDQAAAETAEPAAPEPASDRTAAGQGGARLAAPGWLVLPAAGAGLLVLALLAWLGLRLRARRRKPRTEPTPPARVPEQAPSVPRAEMEALIGAVREAYEAADADAARAALLSWAERVWPEAPPRNLSQLVLRVGPPLRDDLKLLDAAFYGPGDGAWARRPVANELMEVVPRDRLAESASGETAPP
jgi:hypothetical protein